MTIRKFRNSLWVDFRFEGERYRRRSPENTPTGARAFEKALRRKLARGESIKVEPKNTSQTFAEFSVEWMNIYAKGNNKPSEQRGKESILQNHLIPVFGKLTLDDIGISEVDRFKSSRLDLGLSPKTINNHLTVLRKCLQTAFDWNLLKKVPKIQWLRWSSPRRDFLTIEESTRLIRNTTDPKWYAMILLGVRTGMRLGELFGVRWEDVDFHESVITVRCSILEGVESSTKTHRERKIAFPTSVGVALKNLGPNKGLIFKRDDNRPLSHGIAEHALNMACQRAGLRHIGWHTLRHSCASQLAQLRGNSLEAQRMLGHTSIAMTERYTHIVPQSLHDAVATLDTAADLINVRQPAGNSLATCLNN